MVPIEEYYDFFPKSTTVYGSEAFIRLNLDKADAVRCFVGFDDCEKPRLGIVLGLKEDVWRAPFSAPFADISYNKVESIERIYDFISELADLLEGKSIKITLSPPLYCQEMWNRTAGILANYAAKTIWDYNYHYPLHEMDNYFLRLGDGAKRNYKRAKKQGFDFFATEDAEKVYELINTHHKEKGYHMAMTLEQVMETAKVVPTDFFLLTQGEEIIASAYCQRVADDGAQLINWGDRREYSSLRPMNWIAYKICQYYSDMGLKIFDFGPASTNGIPNAPLCQFKQSLGCDLTLKPTFLI